ncbi:MAG: hypothetical protein FWB78_10235 [Treponema sp.]|nr:hypothetical protein [Treponema sp.]
MRKNRKIFGMATIVALIVFALTGCEGPAGPAGASCGGVCGCPIARIEITGVDGTSVFDYVVHDEEGEFAIRRVDFPDVGGRTVFNNIPDYTPQVRIIRVRNIGNRGTGSMTISFSQWNATHGTVDDRFQVAYGRRSFEGRFFSPTPTVTGATFWEGWPSFNSNGVRTDGLHPGESIYFRIRNSGPIVYSNDDFTPGDDPIGNIGPVSINHYMRGDNWLYVDVFPTPTTGGDWAATSLAANFFVEWRPVTTFTLTGGMLPTVGVSQNDTSSRTLTIGPDTGPDAVGVWRVVNWATSANISIRDDPSGAIYGVNTGPGTITGTLVGPGIGAAASRTSAPVNVTVVPLRMFDTNYNDNSSSLGNRLVTVRGTAAVNTESNITGADLILQRLGLPADQYPIPADQDGNSFPDLNAGPERVQLGRFTYRIRVEGTHTFTEAGRSFQLRSIPNDGVIVGVPMPVTGAASGTFNVEVDLPDGIPLHSAMERIRFGVFVPAVGGTAGTPAKFGEEQFQITRIWVQRTGTRAGVTW